MLHFCTYFDINFLPRGLTLHHSLKEHCPEFRLWILCLDRACFEALSKLNLQFVDLIALEDFESDDKALLAARQNRSLIEYYFTCTPSLPLFVLKHNLEVEIITYLDADLFFFANPGPIFSEIDGKSVALIAHRFPDVLKVKEVHGIYNVGWLSFRRNDTGLSCLNWWRDRCIEWCYDRIEDGRYADQKYLDVFPERFTDATVIQHKGANVAPWNLANYCFSIHNNKIWVDDEELIFFHFHRLTQIENTIYDPGLSIYGNILSKIIEHHVYRPYIRLLRDINKQVLPLNGSVGLLRNIRLNTASNQTYRKKTSFIRRYHSRLRKWVDIYWEIYRHRYLRVK